MTKKRYTLVLRKKHLKNQVQSKLSARAYCRKHNIPYTTFVSWRGRYTEYLSKIKNSEHHSIDLISSKPKLASSNFIKVNVQSSHTPSLKISLPNGFGIEVNPNLNSNLLKALIQNLLEVKPC